MKRNIKLLQKQIPLSRRSFLKLSGYTFAGYVAAAISACSYHQPATPLKPNDDRFIWAYLAHLGFNMWADRKVAKWGGKLPQITKNVRAHKYLRCDQTLWDDIVEKIADSGMNMMVIDIGEGLKYESHPELAVKGSWSHKRFKNELTKIRNLGIEPIPKLNFSTAHDIWLGPYSRAVSTPEYYAVCSDIITEVIKLFEKPRFFHLGYDEENAGNQRRYNYMVVRQHELWWHDFDFFVNQVEKHGVRPWIWSDYAWSHPQTFYKKMPTSVLQSNWYYGTDFDKYECDSFGEKDSAKTYIDTYIKLDKHGYDQIPTASNWSLPENFEQTVDFCRKHIAPEHLKGFLQTPWAPTLEIYRQHHIEAIQVVADVIAKS